MVLPLKRTLVVFVALGLADPAVAQSVDERSYTWEKLDAFWGRTLGGSAPDLSVFEPLSSAAPEVPAAVPAGNGFGVPLPGDVIGEIGGGGPAEQGVRFPVIPLDPAATGLLMRRLAWAELYLARYRAFESTSLDPADVLSSLERRQWAALVEVYLTHARLYYAAASLPDKCLRVRRLHELADILPAADPDLAGAWAPLWPIVASVRGRVEDAPLAALSCSVDPVRGRAETMRRIEERVRARIALAARDKVQENLTLLNEAATEFQSLVNAMDVDIMTAEILELERNFGNAAANLRMVAEDQLQADVTIARLDDVDLSALARPGESAELDGARNQLAGMVAEIDAVLTEIAAMADVDAAAGAQLAVCDRLAGLYQTLDLTLDTGVLTAEVEAPYNACLAAARSLVDARSTPTLQTVLVAEFARHLAQLSEVYVASISP